ncbi:hypothetical protein MNBD_NITROSPINAE04-1065 [hydrothermal vent metagenome]|uniref:Uncharacterized protein n=1 Tax=hydrothermal vent metagenome TaxID=652676 RepID=A0A3B1BZC9_9ZZZZ
MNLSDKTMTLFLTYGGSLESWEDAGLIDREMAIYRKLLDYMGGLQVYSYGAENEKRYENIYPDTKTLLWPFSKGRRFHDRIGQWYNRHALTSASVYKTNQIFGAMAAVQAKRMFRKPLIVRCGYIWTVNSEKEGDRGYSLAKKKRIERRCFMEADICVVTTRRDKQEIVNTHGIAENKIRIIPNYVDTEMYTPVKDSKEDSVTVIFVGRLSEEKNLFNLLAAVEKTGRVDKLIMVGDGDLMAQLKTAAKGMQTKVDFLGRKPTREIPGLLRQSDIFVLPSLYEGLPKALLEAMSVGLPCLGTDVRGIRDVIKHGETGWLCATDPEAIASGLMALIDDRDLRLRLSENARRLVEENYSLDKVTMLELDVIKEALEIGDAGHIPDGKL